MSVIPITVFFSLLLAGIFVVLFLRDQRRRDFSCAERDSLLPLADEAPRLAATAPESADARAGARGQRPAGAAGRGAAHRSAQAS